MGWMEHINTWIYPYMSDDWQTVVEKYNIKIPSIIDKSMGISTCLACGARYAGYEQKCVAQVMWHREPNHQYFDYGIDVRGYDPNSVKNFLTTCSSPCNWSLAAEFSLQVDLFYILNEISHLPDDERWDIARYHDILPPEARDKLEKKITQARIYNLEITMEKMVYRVNEMARLTSDSGSLLSQIR